VVHKILQDHARRRWELFGTVRYLILHRLVMVMWLKS